MESSFDPVSVMNEIFTQFQGDFEAMFTVALPVIGIVVGGFLVIKLGKRFASKL